MAIPIEGLVPREPNQEKNDAFLPKAPLSLDGTTDILSSQGGKRDRRASRAQSILLAGLTTFSPLLAACGERQVSAGTSPSVQEATAEAFTQQNPDVSNVYNPVESNPELSATAEAQKPPTPEAKPEPIACTILPPEYCAQAELLDWKDPSGNEFKLVGFKNLPPGTPIRSPINGQVAKTTAGEPYVGFDAGVRDLTGQTRGGYVFIGDLSFDNMFSLDVKTGDIIGYVGNTGVKNFGEYSLIFRITTRDPATGKFFTPKDILEEYFPDITSKSINKSIHYGGQIKPVVVDVFVNK